MADSDGRLVLNNQNHAALIVIVVATWLVWTLLVLVVRVAGKTKLKVYDWEEVCVLVSSLLAVCCSSTIFAAVSFGLGKRNAHDVVGVDTALYAADLLYICTLGVSKGATIFLIRRLTRVRSHVLACYVIAGLVVAWTLVSFLILAIRCHISAPWLSQNMHTCSNLFARWAAVEAIGMTIELMMLGLATMIIINLQMPLTRKCKGIFAFTTRLPLCAIIALRLYYLHTAFSSSNITFSLTNATITTQSALHFSVIAASFAYLKPFLSFFDSGLGATVKLDTLAPSSYANGSYGKGSHAKYSKTGTTGTLNSNMNGRQDMSGRQAERDLEVRNSSQDSKAPIILKTQTYEVRYETDNP